MRRFIALVATVAVSASGVFAVVRPHVSPIATPRSSPALHGALVFSVEVNGDVSRLYRWDLASGRVETGSTFPPSFRSLMHRAPGADGSG